MTAQCVGRFFRTDGKYLGRAYKEHLSGFDDWEQKSHADEWVLLEQNMGERLSIDETMLHHDLFTFLSNKAKDRKKARKALHKWYKNVGKTRIRELISVRDSIKSKEEYILNYFNNRSTNASAESFNSKIKGLRAQVHGVNDLPFFMFRCAKIFG